MLYRFTLLPLFVVLAMKLVSIMQKSVCMLHKDEGLRIGFNLGYVVFISYYQWMVIVSYICIHPGVRCCGKSLECLEIGLMLV